MQTYPSVNEAGRRGKLITQSDIPSSFPLYPLKLDKRDEWQGGKKFANDILNSIKYFQLLYPAGNLGFICDSWQKNLLHEYQPSGML